VRDLKQLSEGGYCLEDVQPFDLFPHTRHLECVMTLVRALG
jgi:tRNA/tmRNA/rRNA uracil-C5-methylase (TrmA/RlmC/RlmD family)